ncbi:hypothetical protein YC2023_106557 [Brassica napus]
MDENHCVTIKVALIYITTEAVISAFSTPIIGTDSVLGMSVDMCDLNEDFYINEKAFENMRNLLYIRIYRSNDANPNKMKLPDDGLSYLPQLRLLQWDAYPHMFLPSRFRTECLVELSMSHSKLKTLWGDNAQGEKYFSTERCMESGPDHFD